MTLERVEAYQRTMTAVLDAVIVAGGIGSRMLPASAAIAKEALPLVDIPVLTHLAREAVAAGVKRIHIVTSPSKDFSPLLSDNSWLSSKRDDIDASLLSPFSDVEVLVHVQKEPRGFGDALSTSLHAINGPFLVLLGDNLLMDSHSGLSSYEPSNASSLLVEAYQKTGLPCVGLVAVIDTENYGVVSLNGDKIVDIIEKPSRENAPSNLVLCGRYLFTEDTAELFKQYDYSTYGELQSIAVQRHWMQNEGLIGIELKGFQWYDSGAPLPWLKGQIDHALRRDDMSEELQSWLREKLQR
jgi:UTP--glucose-1-phosphate uridylyltransferase